MYISITKDWPRIYTYYRNHSSVGNFG